VWHLAMLWNRLGFYGTLMFQFRRHAVSQFLISVRFRFVPKTEQAQRDELSSIVHEADELSHSGSSLQTAIFLLKSKLVRH